MGPKDFQIGSKEVVRRIKLSEMNALYSFGPFTLDPSVLALFRDGEVVPLQPKAVETLIALVQRAGRIVSKEELLKAVWPETFVEEGNLTGNISALRKALGDDSENPTYIETVPRRGYRFRTAVGVRQKTATSAGEVGAGPSSVFQRRPALFIGLLLLILAAVGTLVYWRTGQRVIIDRSEVDSPADAAEVRRVVEDSQAFESLTLYTNPDAVTEAQFGKYWLPAETGGKEILTVKGTVQGLRNKRRRYGLESRIERFEFTYIKILAPGDRARAGTLERWYLPMYENGSRVSDVNAYLGPYLVDYTLKKWNGSWLIAETTTPRKANPKPQK